VVETDTLVKPLLVGDCGGFVRSRSHNGGVESGQFYLLLLQGKGKTYNTPVLVFDIGGTEPERSGLTMLTLGRALWVCGRM
jgi:hypothetical protein